MNKYIYVTEDFQGEELSALSLYGLAGLRSLILKKGRYFYNNQLVYRYVNGSIDSHWLRRVKVCADGVSFSRV